VLGESMTGRCDCTGNDSMTKGGRPHHTVMRTAPARRPKDDESTRSIVGGSMPCTLSLASVLWSYR